MLAYLEEFDDKRKVGKLASTLSFLEGPETLTDIEQTGEKLR